MRSLNAAEFKAKCLAVLDDVDRTGEPVTILKRGRPVARLIAATRSPRRYPQDDLVGSVEILGDIDGPVLSATTWAAERRRRS
jgi:prevent-host-death family protein